jgi:hypothetical protein
MNNVRNCDSSINISLSQNLQILLIWALYSRFQKGLGRNIDKDRDNLSQVFVGSL